MSMLDHKFKPGHHYQLMRFSILRVLDEWTAHLNYLIIRKIDYFEDVQILFLNVETTLPPHFRELPSHKRIRVITWHIMTRTD